MHTLPPATHEARDLFEVAHLAALATGAEPIHTEIWAMRREASALFASNPAAKRAAFIRLNPSNDMFELVSFGRKGGWKLEWVFGPTTKMVRLA